MKPLFVIYRFNSLTICFVVISGPYNLCSIDNLLNPYLKITKALIERLLLY